jgi:hypothetical protein
MWHEIFACDLDLGYVGCVGLLLYIQWNYLVRTGACIGSTILCGLCIFNKRHSLYVCCLYLVEPVIFVS